MCFAHTSTLVVKEALSQTADQSVIKNQCRKVDAFLRSSTSATEKTSAIQKQMGKSKKKFVQEVETAHFMLQRIYEECKAVGGALTSLDASTVDSFKSSHSVFVPFHATLSREVGYIFKDE
ncbi:hypothetical protein QQF64_011623 [Cirrhinus molitorella]|uniref:Uncharacterized protein n=1 Tax=Cirrhinus molitorella TaxID=172907 RepID=A0ABR3LZT5_9TELE